MTPHVCLSCGRPEQQVPLLSLVYQGNPNWICPQCLPMLIHQPSKLAGKIEGAEGFASAAPDH
jgi:hypothetical protein